MKKTKKWIVIGIVLILAIGCGGFFYYKSNEKITVNVISSSVEDITQTVDLSGTIISLDKQTFFADIDGKIGSIDVSAGDYVSKGEVLYSYDKDELENQILLSNLKLQSAEGSYDNTMQKAGINAYRNNEAKINLEVLDQQITDWDLYVKSLQKKISDKQSSIASFGTLLQITLLDLQDNPTSDEYINIQKQIQWNNYEMNNNEDIIVWKRELERAQTELAEFKSYKNQMLSQENSTRDSTMTGGAKNQLKAELETAQTEAKNKSTNYEKACDGIVAEFNGIVTGIEAIEGSLVSKGSKILTLESIDDIAMKVQLTKYDLEQIELGQVATININNRIYSGTVSKINAYAEKNENGSSIVNALVSIDNPDSNLILGIEGKIKIKTGETSSAIVIPNEVINYDANGPFVMVVRDGVLQHQIIETGLMTDMKTQVISGLEANDLIVIDNIEVLKAGEAVKTVLSEG